MRIIAGKFKSRKIQIKIPDNVRPTTDSLRETIFNIVQNILDFDSINVIDICAGTGMMGFEAISRGADFCIFIEKNKRTTEIIKSIANLFNLNSNDYLIITEEAKHYFKSESLNSTTKFNLIFIDPPYDLKITNEIIASINPEILCDKALIIAETGFNEIVLIPKKFRIITERISGTTKITILQKT